MTDYFDLRLTEDELRAISSVGLAHCGDAVYELLVRSWLCAHGRATGKSLHRATVELVRAGAQAVRADRVLPLLTEEEQAVFKRGRNAHVHTVPASASRADYLKATALECLLGWLYLRGERGRINQLFAAMMEETDDAT
ncbi:MAG: ribonuclease III [Oscillospiraceae bacterium]|jgi:ribonuclease-3 family protein|nr:ribonuclease III [Oscillospiraceae bacterium]